MLALPKDTLAADLHAILHHAVEHFALYEEYAETHDRQWDTLSAPLHAIVLLGELPDSENLEAILTFLGAEENVLEFHLDDLHTQDMWEPVTKLAIGNFDRVAAFVRTPCPDVFSRIVISEAMRHLAWTWPEQAAAVAQWYKEQLGHFAQLPDGDPTLNDTLMAALISNCVDLNLTELLPEIETLFNQERVEAGYAGDWNEVRRDMLIHREIPEGQTVLPLAARYADMLEIEEASRGHRAEEERWLSQYPERGLMDHDFGDSYPPPVETYVR